MSPKECAPYLEMVPEWAMRDDKFIERDFEFADFVKNLEFVNAVGDVAEEEGHHPDLFIHGWNKLRITLWTHAIDGLTINDFIVASKIDRLPR
jgi:4a-hydroxytetrahydrobiopterin dehydratase